MTSVIASDHFCVRGLHALFSLGADSLALTSRRSGKWSVPKGDLESDWAAEFSVKDRRRCVSTASSAAKIAWFGSDSGGWLTPGAL
eukprot:2311210-Alexandrium_andersonii.AAC.2